MLQEVSSKLNKATYDQNALAAPAITNTSFPTLGMLESVGNAKHVGNYSHVTTTVLTRTS